MTRRGGRLAGAPMCGQRPPAASRLRPRHLGPLCLAGVFVAVSSRAVADPAATGGWLAFLAQQSLRERAAALAALGLLALVGGAFVVAALLAAEFLARRFGVDPPQGGPSRPRPGSDRDPRRSRSARRRREDP